MAKRGTPFDKLLTEAVDGALLCLGDSARQAIYFHLEEKFRITKGEIPNQLDSFKAGLEKIFGASGATYLEILIMKELYEKIEEPLEWNETKDLAFVDYVTAAKQSYSRTKKQT
ncbi:MAG: hypothetical protein ABSC91_01005 [Candidatus Bathyarchaeia archaeon]